MRPRLVGRGDDMDTTRTAPNLESASMRPRLVGRGDAWMNAGTKALKAKLQ